MTRSSRGADRLRAQSPMAGLDRRNLGPVQVFAQSVSGAAPAAAMAVVPALVAASSGSATIWSIAVATVLALLVASCIGRFTRRMAAAGSLYSLTAKGLGPGPAFLCGSGLLIGYGLLAMATLTGAAIQLSAVLTRLGLPPGFAPLSVIGAVLMLAALVATLTVRGVRLSAVVVLLVETVSIGVILVVFAILLAQHGVPVDTAQLTAPADVGLGAIAAGVLPALALFIGFEAAVALGVEARRPFHTIPRAVRRTAALTGTLGLFAAYTQVAMFAASPGGLAANPNPIPTAAASEQLPWLSLLLDAGLATSFFACALAATTALVRLLFTAGREGVLPAALGTAHRRHRTPHVAVAVAVPVVSVVPAVLVGWGIPPSGALSGLLTTAALGYLLAYLLVCLAAPVFLHRIGELTVDAVLATVVIVPVLLAVLVAFVGSGPVTSAPLVVGSLLVLAAIRYLWLRRRHPERVAAIGMYDETSAGDLVGAPVAPGR